MNLKNMDDFKYFHYTQISIFGYIQADYEYNYEDRLIAFHILPVIPHTSHMPHTSSFLQQIESSQTASVSTI